MKKIKLISACAFLASIAPFTTHAQTQQITPTAKTGWGLHVGQLFINDETAAVVRQGIEESALLVGVSWHHNSRELYSNLNLDFIGYTDNDPISSDTIDNQGNISTSTSNASAFMISAATGPKQPFGKKEQGLLYAQAGLAGIFGSQKGDINCIDCREEDIELDGGFLVKAGIRYQTERLAFGADYTNFAGSDDLDQSITFTISTRFKH